MADSSPESTRYEVKMTCPELYLADVRSWVCLHPDLFLEAYPPRQVNNIYLDTYAADYMRDHLDGVGSRQKLRFRWYGEDHKSVQGVLEQKCKSGHLGWKRRWPIPGSFDLAQTSWHEWLDRLRGQTSDEALVWLNRIHRPTLINRYVREYYETIEDQIRLTIDYQMRMYDQVSYSAPNLAFPIPSAHLVVIEVKSSPADLSRLSGVFSGFPIRAMRSSKYVTGMQSTWSP